MKMLYKGLIFTSLFLMLNVYIPQANASTAQNAAALYNQGIDYYSQNEIQKSIAAFKQAIAINPKFYEAYYNLAKIQNSYKYYNDAIQTYEKLLEIVPEDFESMYEVGQLLYKRGYLSKSLGYLDRIPDYSEYYDKAQKLIPVIEKRQEEIAEETRIKNEMAKRSAVIGSIQAPSGIATDSSGSIYIASFSANSIYKIAPDGIKTVFQGPQTLSGPLGLAIDDNDNVYVANYTKGNVIKISPDNSVKVLLYVKKPYCLNVDNKNKKLLITEQEKNTVIKYDLSGEIITAEPDIVPVSD